MNEQMINSLSVSGAVIRAADRSYRERYGMSLDACVRKWEAVDPDAFARIQDPEKRAFVAGVLENLDQHLAKTKGVGWRLDQGTRDLFRREGTLAEQQEAIALREQAAAFRASGNQTDAVRCEAEAEKRDRLVEATTTSDVATIARGLVQVVTRGTYSWWVANVVFQFPMAAASMNVGYLDFLYNSTGGAYSDGQRVDNQEDPTFGNRTSCTADANKIRARIQAETMTAEDKLIGAEICLSAQQNAQDMWGQNLMASTPEKILFMLWREVYRAVVNDWLAMASYTNTWSSTATGVYTTLDPKVYEATLGDSIEDLSTSIEGATFQRPDFMAGKHTAIARLIKLRKVDPVRATMLLGQPTSFGGANGNFGDHYEDKVCYRDPFMTSAKILQGITRFQTPGNEGQAPYALGLLHADQVRISTLYKPLTTVTEMGATVRHGRKMFRPDAYGVTTIS